MCSKVQGWKAQGWLEELKEGFPGGSVVQNLPANTGDSVSIPDLGRSHMPWSNQAHAAQNYLPCALEPGTYNC